MPTPQETLTEFYAAEADYVAAGGPGRGDFAPLARRLDPDVVVWQAPGLPFSGTGEWRGHAGVEAWMATFAETWSSMKVRSSHVLADASRVVAILDVAFRSRASGRELMTSIVQVIAVREGRIHEIRPFYWDPQAVRDACAVGA